MAFLSVFFFAYVFINYCNFVSGIDKKIDNEITIEKLLDSYSNNQISNLNVLSTIMLKRMQLQNEQNTENMGKCYEQIGKYTRFINKRRDLYHYDSFNENNLHVNDHFRDNQSKKDSHETKASFVLLKELNFYLAELERNYNIIQELRSKIDSMNKANSLGSSISVVTSTGNLNGNKTDSDCSLITGIGYLHIDVPALEEKPSRKRSQQDNQVSKKQSVLCENQWIVIQQRMNGFETSFNRSWRDYREGFGSLRSDFWLGLEIISRLTRRRSYKLLIELTDWSDQFYMAQYDHFEVGPESDNYRLSLSERYSGNASANFLDDIYFGFLSQNGAFFSTYDNYNKFKTNNISHVSGKGVQLKNCALRSGGGWWFNNFSNCLPVNLNGIYVTGASAPSARGIKWQAVRILDRNYSLKKSKIKIKPNF